MRTSTIVWDRATGEPIGPDALERARNWHPDLSALDF